ncbi:NADH-quinone oxidoreductase subunit M, partial [bacterium]|nr:NADH-quinone oxidoreductase subunit M [bacterium]
MNLLGLFLIPFVAGLLLFLFGKQTKLAQWANLLFHLFWGVAVWQCWSNFNAEQMGEIYWSWNWLPMLNSKLDLGLDGLSMPLVILNYVLSLLLAFYCLGKEKLSSSYLALFSILNAASIGSLISLDAFAFYIFWEFMLIPMYFLIGKWGSKNRVYAALKFFAFTMAGSLLMLLAIIALSKTYGTLSWIELKNAGIVYDGLWGQTGLIFLGFLIAFSVKIPIWPVHTWLPDAHTEAPTGASVILAGVLLKLGVYGIARWCLVLFPEASQDVSTVMMTLGAIGIVAGSFAAWKQVDIKRMIAYSSVAHLGFMVLGLFALNVEALSGAMFQNLAHGLSTGALFLIFGIIYDRTHTRKVADYGGLASKNGLLASAFVFSAMASIGLPGLPGFIGEFLILSGTFFTNKIFAFVGLSGVLLGAIYMLGMLRKVVFGPVGPAVEAHPIVLEWNEWVAIVPLLLLMLVLGMGPQLILSKSMFSTEWIMGL